LQTNEHRFHSQLKTPSSMRAPSAPPLREVLPQQLLGPLQLPRPKPLLGPLLHRFAAIVFHARLGVHLARDLLGHLQLFVEIPSRLNLAENSFIITSLQQVKKVFFLSVEL
jgi:hypothetical protein